MKNFWALYQKDLRFLFRQPLTFVFLALLGLLNNWVFLNLLFLNRQANLQALWQNMPFFLILLAPLISTVIHDEEEKTGSWEILASLPLTESAIVLAKLTASLSLLALAIVETAPLAITVAVIGHPDLGLIFSGYLACMLLSIAYLTASFSIANLSRQSLANFFLGFLLLLGDDLLGQEFVLARLPGKIALISRYLSLRSHYQNIAGGLLTLGDITFIASWLLIFAILAFLMIKRRRK